MPTTKYFDEVISKIPLGVGIVQGTLTKDGEVKVLVSHESQPPQDKKRQPWFACLLPGVAYPPGPGG